MDDEEEEDKDNDEIIKLVFLNRPRCVARRSKNTLHCIIF